MEEELISVILPIYNVEKYLEKCLKSVINQTYKNLEIILVDDGSKDNSPQICDEYAVKDKRIVVIHKSNGGLSDARNAGIEIAKGKYITLIDSDDYVELEMYEKLYNKAISDNLDIAICGNYNVSEDYKNKKVNLEDEDVRVDHVEQQKNVVVVSFDSKAKPVKRCSKQMETLILNCFASSLLDNVKDCKKIIYRCKNKRYKSSHRSFGFNEVYASA